MTYNANIPQSTDVPSQSQEQILNNFTALNTIFAEDHVTFNAIDGGEHSKVTFNNVAADPGLGTPKASLYTKADVAGTSQLFFENFDILTTANIIRQLTNLPITTTALGGTIGGTQYTWLTPWGMRFTMGISANITGTNTEAWSTAFTSAIYAVIGTPTAASVSRFAISATTANLTIAQTSASTINYLAIGD